MLSIAIPAVAWGATSAPNECASSLGKLEKELNEGAAGERILASLPGLDTSCEGTRTAEAVSLRIGLLRVRALDMVGREEEALERVEGLLGRQLPETSETASPVLGLLEAQRHLLGQLGRTEEILGVIERSLSFRERMFGAHGNETILGIIDLALYHKAQDDEARAERYLREAIARGRAADGASAEALKVAYMTYWDLLKTDEKRKAEADALWCEFTRLLGEEDCDPATDPDLTLAPKG